MIYPQPDKHARERWAYWVRRATQAVDLIMESQRRGFPHSERHFRRQFRQAHNAILALQQEHEINQPRPK